MLSLSGGKINDNLWDGSRLDAHMCHELICGEGLCKLLQLR